jgi:hypothetical protein
MPWAGVRHGDDGVRGLTPAHGEAESGSVGPMRSKSSRRICCGRATLLRSVPHSVGPRRNRRGSTATASRKLREAHDVLDDVWPAPGSVRKHMRLRRREQRRTPSTVSVEPATLMSCNNLLLPRGVRLRDLRPGG